MRDIAVTLMVFGALPLIFMRPWFGIIVWTWLGFMNPHRMAWGFSTTMPFAMIVALCTLLAMLASKEEKKIPWTRESITLLLFVFWMFVTTIFAVYQSVAWLQFEKVIKIQLMVFVAMMLVNDKFRLQMLVATIALSLGFYGLKGGIFTILKGGVYRVQGPPGTFIGGNNELGLALCMTIPLLIYLGQHAWKAWMRPGFYVLAALTAIATVGTQSRGAMLGIVGMATFLWLKSRQKFTIAVVIVVAAAAALSIMPDAYFARMNTISNYQTDYSATSRLNAWQMAFNLAKDRPLGGGFETFQREMFFRYAPDPWNWRDVHSVYFEIMGEHGFFGLFLFLLLALFTWRSAAKLHKDTRREPEWRWLGDLARMVQVSMIAYLLAGAFLGMAYFDFYYNLVLIIVVGRTLYARQHPARRITVGPVVVGRPRDVPAPGEPLRLPT